MGFEKKFGYHNQNKLLGFYLEIGNNNFLEFFHDPKIENKASQIKHFCLEVDYIDSMIEKLSIAGIDVTDKKLGKDKIWQCWIEDPNELPWNLKNTPKKVHNLRVETDLLIGRITQFLFFDLTKVSTLKTEIGKQMAIL